MELGALDGKTQEYHSIYPIFVIKAKMSFFITFNEIYTYNPKQDYGVYSSAHMYILYSSVAYRNRVFLCVCKPTFWYVKYLAFSVV